MIRPIRETPIIPSEIQINCPSRLLDTSAPITTKRAANCRAENSPDRNANNRDFLAASSCCLQKQKFFQCSIHLTSPLHLVLRADMRLPHIPVEGAGFQQFLMRTLCADSSILYHNNVVCVNNGRQPVCNHNQGLADSQSGNGFLYQRLISGSM